MLDFDADDLGVPDAEPKAVRKTRWETNPQSSPIVRRHYEIAKQAQHSSKSVEHYTPSDIIARAHRLLGGIDLDPASSYVAQRTVQAAQWYGIQADGSRTDGLMSKWQGSVWLNPPGGLTADHAPHLSSISKSYACIWWGRLWSAFNGGEVIDALFLGFTLELLASVQRLTGVGYPLEFPTLFVRQRIRFDYPEDTREGLPLGETDILKGTQPTHSNFLTYLSSSEDSADRFRASFGDLGFVVG